LIVSLRGNPKAKIVTQVVAEEILRVSIDVAENSFLRHVYLDNQSSAEVSHRLNTGRNKSKQLQRQGVEKR
jgi:hypothetical protein